MILNYILFSILNVIIQTIKSIATIKCNKYVASVVNAVAYGLYTYIIFITSDESLGLWFKIIVVAIANLIGVFIVKYFEEKNRKDKMWLVKMTIPTKYAEQAKQTLEEADIPFTYYDLNKYYVFDTFCENQAQTTIATKICFACQGKAFASENKLNL